MQIPSRTLSICGLTLVLTSGLLQAGEPKLPSFQQVQQIVESHFQSDANHRQKDLISRSQVAAVLDSINLVGWRVPDAAEVLADVLPDDHVLVRSLRTPAGRRVMAKVSRRELMYDRLDRVSNVSGGPRLIEDLVKLPDGEKYAKPRSGGGVPDLLDLLPKNGSGKTRRIPDYDKPTGHIYTVSDLLARLAKSYDESRKQQPDWRKQPAEKKTAGRSPATRMIRPAGTE